MLFTNSRTCLLLKQAQVRGISRATPPKRATSMTLNQTSPDSRLSGPPPGFTCVTRTEGPGVNRVTLSGELDMASAPQLADALSEASRDCMALLILDLSDLEFMDSTGLQTILTAHTRLAEADCRLVLIAGCHQVQQIFEITRTAHQLAFVNASDLFDQATRCRASVQVFAGVSASAILAPRDEDRQPSLAT